MSEESAANDLAHEPGLSREEISKRYTEWSKNARYEEDLRAENYRGPIIVADFTARQFPNESERGRLVILDVAAGSGFVGEELTARGFTVLDALEPSEGMLSLAKSKDIYRRMFQCYLNGEQLQVESNYYDLAVICGGMGEGHIPCSGLIELIRVVKPGGLVIIAMREAYLTTVHEYKDRLEPMMKEFERDDKWESLSRTVVPRYSFDNNGIIYIFRVKDSS
uniref:Methyltransferase domain-containing protein n=1 Tax=Arion vulgaris TaxID=1028688 RepID=A0A0B6ZMB4_9EUPU